MSQHPAIWLAAVLRDAGCKVKTYDGWVSRGRPITSGGFDPQGLLIHHTGTHTSMKNPAPSVRVCIDGRMSGPSPLPGPLCQAVLGFDGLYHVIAAGRANHAGSAQASGPMPAGDGNELYIGFEVDYSGSQDMGALQYEALIKGSAAVLEKLGKPASFARGHKETSSAGKWDPGRKGSTSPEYLMAGIRADIAEEMNRAELWRVIYLTPKRGSSGRFIKKAVRTRDVADWMRRHPGALQRGRIEVTPVKD